MKSTMLASNQQTFLSPSSSRYPSFLNARTEIRGQKSSQQLKGHNKRTNTYICRCFGKMVVVVVVVKEDMENYIFDGKIHR